MHTRRLRTQRRSKISSQRTLTNDVMDFDETVNGDVESEKEETESEETDGVSDDIQVDGKLSLAAAFEAKVRPFIDLVDELRRHGLEQDINLPSVVVLGDQSSGKSSILEAISGIQLPRGSGIVTRCPLEMQLKKAHDPKAKWKARLRYMPKIGKEKRETVEDPSEMESMIREAQNDIAGGNKGISPSLITLQVEAPNCPDLTLIDLPGIARTAVEDQPHDICDQIKHLLRDYIEKPHTIMLCVIPANVDIAVNEAVTLAREVDPDGIRTLGVLTKPDLVDSGTEADVLAILNNEKVYLKKGYNIVKCRGQQDILENIDLEEALRKEERFFSSHRVFKKAEPELRGTKNLSMKLTENLVEHIEATLPRLRDEVRRQLHETREKLNKMAEGPPNEEAEKRLYLMRLLDRFLSQLDDAVRKGTKVPPRAMKLSHSDVNRINTAYKWRHDFTTLKNKIDKLTKENLNGHAGELTVHKIQVKMDVYRGRELPRFINFELFESLVQEHVGNYEEPCLCCLETTSTNLLALVEYVAEECLRHVPAVKCFVRGVCEEVREICKTEGKSLLELEMRKERLVYTQDPTYVHQLKELEAELREKAQQANRNRYNPSISFQVTKTEDGLDEAEHNAQVMQQLLKVYLDVANRRILDNIPMLIRTTQHHDFIDLLREKLHKTASGDQVNELVQEDLKLTAERRRLQEKARRLTHAMTKLNYSP